MYVSYILWSGQGNRIALKRLLTYSKENVYHLMEQKTWHFALNLLINCLKTNRTCIVPIKLMRKLMTNQFVPRKNRPKYVLHRYNYPESFVCVVHTVHHCLTPVICIIWQGYASSHVIHSIKYGKWQNMACDKISIECYSRLFLYMIRLG